MAFAALVVAGCGPEKQENDGGGIDLPPADSGDTARDTTGPIDATSDTGPSPDGPPDWDTTRHDGNQSNDGGGTCGGTTCKSGQFCVEGSCVDATQSQCNSADDLGTLQHGNKLVAKGAFDEARDGLKTNCSTSNDGPERVFKFEVAKSSQIDFKTTFNGSFDAKLEFRQGGCDLGGSNVGENGGCYDSQRSFYSPAGTTWYLVVEQDIGSGGSFEVELDAKPACSFGPLGSYGCKQGDRYLCERKNDGSLNEKKFACADSCKNGRCAGDSCTNPVVVDKSNGGMFSGELFAYSPKWDFSNNSRCKVNGTAVQTPGPDVVFKVTGVKKSDQIEIDTSNDPFDNYIYVTNSCASSVGKFSCIDTADRESFTYNPSSAGDYYVIVDRPNVQGGTFKYRVELK